ncbi:hypothetical protein ACWOAY_08635 [Granulicatella adiacens]|uniref:hypothetical protein n=1 Tax=Granulicatella adiacens TaxID=46124 RepID=UPI0021D85637|nr:hypothetical protein [Granulicatella adiacens]UXY41078.1 hypothetical protein N8I82_07680 [Granulicatella adiacens]
MREIKREYGNRYYDVKNPLNVISNIYFHQLYITKTYNALSDNRSLKQLACFYEVMKRLNMEDRIIIYEKYFKYAMMRQSKDKYKNKANVQEMYIVKEVSNVEHAKAMNITINEYKERLDRALRNYLNTLIDVITE